MWCQALILVLVNSCSGFTVPPLGKCPHASINRFPHLKSPHATSISSPPVSNTETTSEKKTASALLLRQTENFLLGSKLIYMYADLRVLSYCGYTKTSFEELDCNKWAGPGEKGSINDTQGITVFKILEVFLSEVEWNLHGRKTLKSIDQNTLCLLQDSLKNLLHLEEPNEGTRRSRDLISLQEKIKSAMGEGGFLADLRAEGPGLSSDERTKSLPEKLAEFVLNTVKLVIKFVLSKKPKDEFTDTGEKKLEALITNFSRDCVREGSLLRKILLDDIELVYFSDAYQDMDCVYGIAVNHRAKRVGITFRGSVNIDDWVSNLQTDQIEVPNPAKLETDDQPDVISLHFGYHAYLKRQWQNRPRRDGSFSTRVDRILDRAEKYMEDDDWTLTISGHSRGGCMATLLGFYAAAGNRGNSDKRPVEVISFASPFVGDYRFRKAFKGLERNGKIVHARIVNANDFGTMVPFFPVGEFVDDLDDVLHLKRLKLNWYRHVGLQVILAENKKVLVDYPFKETFLAEIWRTLKSNLFFSLPYVLKGVENHDLDRYERHLLDGIREQGSDKSLDRLLHDYYVENNITSR